MEQFRGFPAKARFTSVPSLFFSRLLPQISDIAELKTTLHIFWLLYQKRTHPRFVTYRELVSDVVLLSGLKSEEKPTDEVLGEALEMAHVLDSRQCDGVIFLGDLRNDENAVRSILMQNHPVVALCRGRSVFSLPTVNVNNEIGIQLLVDHLLSLGHNNFIFVDGGWFGDIHERRSIFLSKMAKIENEINYTWLQAKDNSAAGGYLAMQEISKMKPMPTAIMASDDAMATGILKAAHDLGIKIPEDISVTGFDDIDSARFTYPGLTTVRQPIEKMSEMALDLLQIQIEKEPVPDNKIFNQLTPELVIRDSSGPCN